MAHALVVFLLRPCICVLHSLFLGPDHEMGACVGQFIGYEQAS